ncbi:nucleoside/nucleotide kinase family protein [Gephyromycinifex aptenodytis]|uniref:nucleoside/nucleotide kinase family protein n=1 Tax=Gephyromycinifex aptenodytis TaxID=2716227 RepID=UPI001445790E|nr:nucleoside/nucleotide kinase family protein [Gephyromycinifex aptenodytis]
MTQDAVIERARALAVPGQRHTLGIAGAPGAGKSTLAEAIVAALAPAAVLVPMDGYHLANDELAALGRGERKGAIDTFDDAGYAALLRRLVDQRRDETVYAPRFDRSLEESLAGSIRITAEVPLVVTEGNYLLSDVGWWPVARACLDECWYLDTDIDLRHAWLVARHEAYGKDPQSARHWALVRDEANARLIQSSAHRADLRVRLPLDPGR